MEEKEQKIIDFIASVYKKHLLIEMFNEDGIEVHEIRDAGWVLVADYSDEELDTLLKSANLENLDDVYKFNYFYIKDNKLYLFYSLPAFLSKKWGSKLLKEISEHYSLERLKSEYEDYLECENLDNEIY